MRRTLNQTWVLCLRMWKHLAAVWEEFDDIAILKERWLNSNGFTDENILSDCFFCEYGRPAPGCSRCPGRLVDPSFNCESPEYDYRKEPREFYRELLRLNRIRKVKK